MATKLSAEEVSRYQQDGVVAPITVMPPAVAKELCRRLESAEKSFPHQIGPEKRNNAHYVLCLLYTSPSPRDVEESRMPSSA